MNNMDQDGLSGSQGEGVVMIRTNDNAIERLKMLGDKGMVVSIV